MAVIQGLSTLVCDGAAREKLMRVAATAMLAWPDDRPLVWHARVSGLPLPVVRASWNDRELGPAKENVRA